MKLVWWRLRNGNYTAGPYLLSWVPARTGTRRVWTVLHVGVPVVQVASLVEAKAEAKKHAEGMRG